MTTSDTMYDVPVPLKPTFLSTELTTNSFSDLSRNRWWKRLIWATEPRTPKTTSERAMEHLKTYWLWLSSLFLCTTATRRQFPSRVPVPMRE